MPNRRKRPAALDTTMTTIEDDVFAHLIIPDVLTNGQYHDRVHRDDHETRAVKRLMSAVLSDAVRRLQAYAHAQDPAGRLRFAEAQMWILDREAEGPFAFVTICEALEIEPNRMREGILQFGSLHAGNRKPLVGRRSAGRRTRLRPKRVRSAHRTTISRPLLTPKAASP